MTKKLPALDVFRVVAALLVIAVHVSPLFSLSVTADFIFTRVISRVAVPFFFMTTGYFLFGYEDYEIRNMSRKVIKKTAKLYLFAMLLYLPLNINNGYFSEPSLRLLTDVLFNGTFYHLWYLPAVILGTALSVFVYRQLGFRYCLILAAMLYVIGLGGDSYFGLVMRIPGVRPYYSLLLFLLRYTRNGIFFAPMFLFLGASFRISRSIPAPRYAFAGFIVSLALMACEGLWLRSIGAQRHDSMYIFLVPCMYFLFTLLSTIDGKPSKRLRLTATSIYIIHPWAIVVLWYASMLIGIERVMDNHSLAFFAVVCICSLAASVIIVSITKKLRKPNPSVLGRAWAEVDLEALRHNVAELRRQLPEVCELIAVVKADAYGMGAVKLSAELEHMGIQLFAVAAVAEAVQLRKNGLKGDILVLGSTHPMDAASLRRYKLIQLVSDGAHARALNDSGLRKLRIHLALDTGMRRLGFEYSDIDGLAEVFAMKNLIVEGIATHLASSDSNEDGDIEFTNTQIKRFYDADAALLARGHYSGVTHIQSSYGIYNYAGLCTDYARAGIAMYGVMSHNAETCKEPDLIPVMALKARIAEVRRIEAGESVSYGRSYTAAAPMTLATVSIGYADGVPRQLSGNGGECLVRGKRAPIAGRICMDMLMLDVTGIAGVVPGDVVTLIGCDGDEEIRCEDFAEACGTITNDILCRLGKRLPRIYID